MKNNFYAEKKNQEKVLSVTSVIFVRRIHFSWRSMFLTYRKILFENFNSSSNTCYLKQHIPKDEVNDEIETVRKEKVWKIRRTMWNQNCCWKWKQIGFYETQWKWKSLICMWFHY